MIETKELEGMTCVNPPAKAAEPEYVEAIGRNPGEEYQHSHLYVIDAQGNYLPMCIYGWNRSDGKALSIFRGHSGSRGLCLICQKRKAKGLPGVEWGSFHKTKWL